MEESKREVMLMNLKPRVDEMIYHVIKDGVEFRDLGEDYLTRRNKSQKMTYLRKQAQLLGFDLVPQTT